MLSAVSVQIPAGTPSAAGRPAPGSRGNRSMHADASTELFDRLCRANAPQSGGCRGRWKRVNQFGTLGDLAEVTVSWPTSRQSSGRSRTQGWREVMQLCRGCSRGACRTDILFRMLVVPSHKHAPGLSCPQLHGLMACNFVSFQSHCLTQLLHLHEKHVFVYV